MALSYNSTNAAAMVKVVFRPQYVTNTAASKGSPVFAMIPKDTSGEGATYNFFLASTESYSGSADFATAQGLSTQTTQPTIGQQYALPYVEDWQVATVTADLIRKTASQKGGWAKAIKFAIDSQLRVAGFRQGLAWNTTGFGELAQVASPSGATFICKDTAHVNRFLIGQPLVGSSSLDAAALRSGTALNVTKVSYSDAKITLSGNLATPGITTDDWVFTSGDRQNSATPARVRPIGWPAWIPDQIALATTPDANMTTIAGVDRTADTRTMGFTIDGTNQNLSDGLIQALQTIMSQGNATEAMIGLSPGNFTLLSKSAGANLRYVNENSEAGLGFKAIEINAEGLTAKVFSDKLMGSKHTIVFDKKSFVHVSCGQAPRIYDDDGLTVIRSATAGGVEVRVYSLENIACVNPSACARVNLP